MKKRFCFLFILSASTLFAQNNDNKKKHHWEINTYICNSSRNVTLDYFDHTNASVNDYDLNNKSFAFGISGAYFFNNTIGLRLRFGMTKIKIDANQEYYFSGSKVVNDVVGKQSKNHIGIGIVKKMPFNNFNLIAGFEIPYNREQEFSAVWESTQTDSVNGTTINKFMQ